MADSQHSISAPSATPKVFAPHNRRGFLTAGMATAVALSVAAPAIAKAANPRAEWDAAMARYNAAMRAYEPYENTVRIPEDILKEVGASYRNLLNTPVPDAKALRWKMREILEDAEEDCAMADFDRLIGEA